jgi:hypothetical protein
MSTVATGEAGTQAIKPKSNAIIAAPDRRLSEQAKADQEP